MLFIRSQHATCSGDNIFARASKGVAHKEKQWPKRLSENERVWEIIWNNENQFKFNDF